MKNLLVIQINVPLWGFAGKASGQREFSNDQVDLQHVYLIGDAHQVRIPEISDGKMFALAHPVRIPLNRLDGATGQVVYLANPHVFAQQGNN